jgi:RNA polymerase sigma-70 factor (ECF subfamily)
LETQPWIDDVRRGDPRAWARLVSEHHARVYRLLAHLTRDRHLAEDLCQETFAAAWAHLGTFAGDSQLATWLHRIAYRKFLDHARRAKGGPPGDRRTDGEHRADPLGGLVIDEQTRAIHAALERMDALERAVIVLHYLQELSYREMSAVTGEPLGTVKWRTKVALERLTELMRATETPDEPTTTTSRNPPAAAGAQGEPRPADARRT